MKQTSKVHPHEFIPADAKELCQFCGEFEDDPIHLSQYQLGQADLRASLKKEIKGMKLKPEEHEQRHAWILESKAHGFNQALDAVLYLLQEKGKQ